MSKYLFPNQFRVVCTGRGEHPPRELSVFTLDPNGKRLTPGAGTRFRRTPKGERETVMGQVIIHKRADGGVTFELPACACSPQAPRRLRDDRLKAFLRATPGGSLDVSNIA